ncbi:MAG: TetR/AcrR family transcriptional regulator [Burkholderiaceae bacterium]
MSKTGRRTPPGASRRSQGERSAATRKRLCEAAVALLAEVGFERLTTSQIAQRAQVSKGAQAHHFPTKHDLLVAAFAHLLSGWRARREAFIREVGPRASMEQVLRYLWRDVFGRVDYVASVEMMLAARHDPVLRDRLRELLRSWTEVRDDTFHELVPIGESFDRFATFLQLNLAVLRGLAIVRGLDGDEQMIDRGLRLWIEIATDYAESHQDPAQRRGKPN